jgi:hypothetical protein
MDYLHFGDAAPDCHYFKSAGIISQVNRLYHCRPAVLMQNKNSSNPGSSNSMENSPQTIYQEGNTSYRQSYNIN